jgi:hypothetical protein
MWIVLRAWNLLAELGSELSVHGGRVHAHFLEYAAGHEAHEAAAALIAAMVRALPGRALEAPRGLVSVRCACREGVFERLEARADAVAQLLKPGTRLVFALFQLGFLVHHAFRKVVAKPSFGPDAPLAYMCPR